MEFPFLAARARYSFCRWETFLRPYILVGTNFMLRWKTLNSSAGNEEGRRLAFTPVIRPEQSGKNITPLMSTYHWPLHILIGVSLYLKPSTHSHAGVMMPLGARALIQHQPEQSFMNSLSFVVAVMPPCLFSFRTVLHLTRTAKIESLTKANLIF